jgi:hypothetical protein
MAAPPRCRECDGTGWIPYRSETLDGEFEEAYHLCPGCYTPRCCMSSKSDHPCPRPDIVCHGLGYYCKEHAEVIYADEEVDQVYEAFYFLRCWLQVAHDRANEFLKIQLAEALHKAEKHLRHTEQEPGNALEETGQPN